MTVVIGVMINFEKKRERKKKTNNSKAGRSTPRARSVLPIPIAMDCQLGHSGKVPDPFRKLHSVV